MNSFKFYVLIISVISILSCSQIEMTVDGDEYSSVCLVIPSLDIIEDDVETKMTVSVSNPVSYLWSQTDTVGIFPDTGSQIYFSMEDGVGTSTVSFDGGGWALKKTASYYSYFPFVPNFYLKRNAIPLTFEGQSQKGNSDPYVANVGKYCYMAAQGVADEESGALRFEYSRLGVLHRYKIPVDAGTYTSLSVVTAESVIAYEGTFNAIEIDQAINNARYTNELAMALDDVSFSESATLVVFMMLPPFNILDEQLTLKLTKDDGTEVFASVLGKKYSIGTAYGSAPKLSVYCNNALIDGNGGSAEIIITASGSSSYSISTDVDWLTLDTENGTGSSVVNVTAEKGLSNERIGHVFVSENVTSSDGSPVTISNVVTITQDVVGMQLGLGAWNTDNEDYGGKAI